MPEHDHISLSELNQKIKDVIDRSFSGQAFWVVAEISGHKYYANNERHYFSLVEKVEASNVEVAKISAKSWQSGSRQITEFEKATGQRFTDGLQVLVKVKVEYHVVFGLSLTLADIDVSFTIGNLARQRALTLEKLVSENPGFIQLIDGEYVTANKKLSHRMVIQKIALISSANSQGYADFKKVIATNRYKYSFTIDNYFSTVQGGEAENELVTTLIEVFNSGRQYDVVVLIRGGGNKTDFLVFDTYKLARTVAKFPIPVITGIGHDEDVSIVDLMAHTHTNAPTKAAEFIISHNRAFEDEVIHLQKAVIINSQQRFSKSFQALSQLNASVVNRARNLLAAYKDSLTTFNRIAVNTSKDILFKRKTELVTLTNRLLTRPRIITGNRLNDLANVTENMRGYTRKYFINKRGYLNHYDSVVKLMNPGNILKKGFAIVYYQGKIISNAENVEAGKPLDVRLAETMLTATVNQKRKINGTEFDV